MKDLTKHHAHARLDMARGLAALAVFIAHLGNVFFYRLIGPHHVVAQALNVLARHAVLVFFLMSGNLITRSIVLNIHRNGRFDMLEYGAARVARIYPPLLGAIAVCVCVWLLLHFLHLPGGAVPFGLPGDLYRVRDKFTLSTGDLVHALTMRGGLLEADGPLWSLYIEFQVYVVAMAAAALWRGGWLARLVSCLLALICLRLLMGQLFFVLVWAFGAATALWIAPRRILWAGTAAAIAAISISLFAAPSLFSAGMDRLDGKVLQLICCIPYAALLFYVRPSPPYPRWLIATGNFSYSLYVVHFPLLMLALSLSQPWIGYDIGRTWLVAGITGAGVIAFIIPFAAVTEQQGKFKRLLLMGLGRSG
jgi:peptidoglycan/LPS O-acetylase OafA/YrhL